MAQPIIVSLFDHTGNIVAPWAEAGFLCHCVDLQRPAGEYHQGNIIRVVADIGEWLPPHSLAASTRDMSFQLCC